MQSHSEILDLREINPDLVELIIEARAGSVDVNGSFWMIHDRDPVELYDFILDLGFTMQTFICPPNAYHIFIGRQ